MVAVNLMKKIILILVLVLVLTWNGFSQSEKFMEDGNFLISVHYIGNIRNNNVISNDFNGIAGIDAKYNIIKSKKINFQGGINIDYIQSRRIYSYKTTKNTLLFNPNFGVEIKVYKSLRPFFNLGYNFIKITEKFKFNTATNFDPSLFQSGSTLSNNFNSLSINLGIRILLSEQIFIQTDYKYLPFETNFNVHFLNSWIWM